MTKIAALALIAAMVLVSAGGCRRTRVGIVRRHTPPHVSAMASVLLEIQ